MRLLIRNDSFNGKCNLSSRLFQQAERFSEKVILAIKQRIVHGNCTVLS